MIEFKIKNRTILYHQNNSRVINLRAIVGAGSFQEKPNEFGLAHFLEHMFFKGTKNRSYKEINRITARLGDVNAYTSYDRTVYHLSTLREHFQEATEILLEMLFEPAFPQEEFEKERGVILEEYQSSMDSPTGYFFNLIPQAFEGPLAHPVIGDVQVIQKAELKTLANFRDRFYPNFIFSVCGDIPEEKVQDVLSKVLAAYPPAVESGSEPAGLPQYNFKEVHLKHPAQQAIISFSFKSQGLLDLMEEGYVTSLLSNVLGGGMHSLLFDRIREELGLCYSVGAYHQLARDHGSLMIYCLLDQKNIDLAKEEILKIIEEISKKGVSDALLRTAKANMIFDVAKKLESSGGYSAVSFDAYFKRGKKVFDSENFLQALAEITPQGIQKCAKKILTQPFQWATMTQIKDTSSKSGP